MRKVLLLLSGGFDSAVSYALMRNDLDIITVHFDSSSLTGDSALKKVNNLKNILSINKLIIVPFGNVQIEVSKKCRHDLYYVITRRIMYRIAEDIAVKEKCSFLLTGENLAQVASQTLSNMSVIKGAVNIEILRPLLCNDKVETINLARDMGIFEICSGPELCSFLGPKHPATRSDLNLVLKEEKKVDMNSLIKESLENIKIME